MSKPARRLARSRRLAALACLLLAACGGSFNFGGDFDDDFDGDEPPEVELQVTPDTASPGDTVQLQAVAIDDGTIDRVEFYRIDGALATFLDEDEDAPYTEDDVIPAGATGTVQYFARAIDDDGQRSDSTVVSVALDR